MINKIKSLTKSTGLRQSVLVVAGNGLSAGFSALTLILYSRYLGPVQFGIFSLGFSLTQLVIRLTDGGIHIAVQRLMAREFESDEKLSNRLFVTGMWLKLTLMGGLILSAWLLVPWIGKYWLKTEELSILRLAVGLSAIASVFEYFMVVLQAIHEFFKSVLMTLTQSLTKLILAGLAIIFKVEGVVGPFVLYSITPLLGILVGITSLPSWLRNEVRYKSFEIGKIMKVVKYTWVAIVAAAIGDNIDVLMVKSYLTNYETGLFAVGARMTMLISLLAYSLGSVLSPRVARYQNKVNLAKYLRKAGILMIGSFVLTALIIPFSGFLIWLTAGPEYLEATTTVNYLLASGMVVVATTPLVAVFYAVDKPEYFAWSGLLQTVILIGANMWLIPNWGIDGAGIAKLAARLAVFVFSLIYSWMSVKEKFGINIFHRMLAAKEIEEID